MVSHVRHRLPIWLSACLILLTVASVTTASGHRHHHHPHHSRHAKDDHSQDASSADQQSLHKIAHKRAFGKPLRVWTPSQGPLRRSASSGSHQLEPFLEDSNPGWSFSPVYDIPIWDGGDAAACPSSPPARIPGHSASSSTKSDANIRGDLVERAIKHRPEHKRRSSAADDKSDFCTHGNAPVSLPDANKVCKTTTHSDKLTKRLAPSVDKVQQIVGTEIEAGKESPLADLAPGKTSIPGAGVPSELASVASAGGKSFMGAMPDMLGGGGSGSGGDSPMSGMLDKLGGGGLPGLSQMSKIAKRSVIAHAREPEAKRLVPTFGQIQQIVDTGIEAGKEGHLADVGAGGGAAGTGSAGAALDGGAGTGLSSIGGSGMPVGGLPGVGLGAIPTVGQIQEIVNHGIAAHRAVAAARQRARGAGAVGAGLDGIGALGGAAAGGAPGASADAGAGAGVGAGASPLGRRTSFSAEVPPEVSTLIAAAVHTNAELQARFGSADALSSGKTKRSPLGAPMMMGGMGGMGGGAGMAQMVQTAMPAIVAGIQSLGKVGVAFMSYEQAKKIEQMKEDFARNMTESGHPGVTTGGDASTGGDPLKADGKDSNKYDSKGNWELPNTDGSADASSTGASAGSGSTGSMVSGASSGSDGSSNSSDPTAGSISSPSGGASGSSEPAGYGVSGAADGPNGSAGLTSASTPSPSSGLSGSLGSTGSGVSSGAGGSSGSGAIAGSNPATSAGSAGLGASSGSVGAGATSGSTDPSTASTASSSTPVKRDTSSSSSNQCGGNAQLCYHLIEQAFPYCLPSSSTSSSHRSDSTKYRASTANLVHLLAMHCTLKCNGFTNLAQSSDFKHKAETCTHDKALFSKIQSVASAKRDFATRADSHSSVRRDFSHKSSQKCQSGYQTLFTDAKRRVASYANKYFGSVISDPASFLHWGQVSNVAQCLKACDETKGCVFVNVYQQNFSLEHPTMKLVNRGMADTVQLKKGKEVKEQEEGDDDEEERKRVFSQKPEAKKNSFVQGKLTCALYSRCHLECEAEHRSGDDPVFFDKSAGYCKSKECVSGAKRNEENE